MATLLLRLAAPLQAWGVESKFEIRNTCREPTKSGVVGLLAAALGRRRNEPLDDLNALRFGVRVDQPGKLLKDFHIARKDDKVSYVTTRYYLSDAVFLVGLESGDEGFLKSLETALRNPRFPLFLGRRSCPPTLPICLGIRDANLMEALSIEPWLAPVWRQKKLSHRLWLCADCRQEEKNAARQRDFALSFDPIRRRYGYRSLSSYGIMDIGSNSYSTTHDPVSELR
ncbi:MAG: type I-E CRISPR-associated protein Cas5/CasD [Lentisphaerae bacterium]|nr:type I-E CRISPR-associated protein Cas5/CasD [Lentisphaerota bacterium]